MVRVQSDAGHVPETFDVKGPAGLLSDGDFTSLPRAHAWLARALFENATIEHFATIDALLPHGQVSLEVVPFSSTGRVRAPTATHAWQSPEGLEALAASLQEVEKGFQQAKLDAALPAAAPCDRGLASRVKPQRLRGWSPMALAMICASSGREGKRRLTDSP